VKTENSYDTRTFNKDLVKLQQIASKVANKAMSRTVEKQSAIEMSLDEAEIIPYASPEAGTIVISVKNSNPAALDELLAKTSAEATEALKQDFINGMKEAMK
jgi:hypothetical protein